MLTYRPDNYTPNYGGTTAKDEDTATGTGQEGEDEDDFFGLTIPQKSVQTTSAFPGYQPYLIWLSLCYSRTVNLTTLDILKNLILLPLH